MKEELYLCLKEACRRKIKILSGHENNYISITKLCRVYEISKYTIYIALILL